MNRRLDSHVLRVQPENLGWRELPIVGQDRARLVYRARAWRVGLAGLAIFWAGIGAMIVSLVR